MNVPNETPHLSPDMLEKLQKFLLVCRESQRKMLRFRYGLDDGKPKTVEQTAEHFGISPDWVRLLDNKVFRKPRTTRRIKKIADFYDCPPDTRK